MTGCRDIAPFATSSLRQSINRFWKPERRLQFTHSRVLTTLLAAALLAAAGCATNPVTQKRELALVSTAQEIQIGEQQYAPSRQMFGGDYVVDPAITAYVRDVGARVAAVSDRDLPYEFVVINESTPNAWALPGGKIAIHRGLLTELDSEAELAAVLGHEVVHAAARHGAKSMERGMLLQGVAVATAVTANQTDYGSLIMTATGVGLQLITQKYGRDAERESDYYGMQYMSRAGYDPAAAVELQETFVRLSEGRRSGWLEGLFASHPPSPERVENNKATLAELPPGGELGRERYVAAISPLIESKEAYTAHDRGRKALAAKDLESALAEAEMALRIEPRESHFHSLRGDIRASQRRWNDALINYNRAVNYYPDYFYPLMRRGQVLRKLGDDVGAIADLERSIELLPTAPAMNALGELKLAAGQRDQAVELFTAAARSDSPDGRAAAISLMRLELPEKPYKYIRTAVGQDAGGRLILQLQNRTPVRVEVQQLTIQYLDANDQTRELRRPVSLVMPAEGVSEGQLDPRLTGGTTDPRRIRAGVTQARILD
ncbi:MAG: M48 family metalloprotease [Gammaproteobacteria bacterium]|nr:M48 family metalloprotease [Gammaproteobacteria bacterium]